MANNKGNGQLGGKIGPVIVYERNGKQCVRSMPEKVDNPRTPAQQYNRAKMAAITKLASVLKPWIAVNMQHNNYATPRGAFISLNMKQAFEEVKGEPILNPKKLVVTTGVLFDEEAYTLHKNESNKLEIFWEKDRVISGGQYLHVLVSTRELNWWAYTLYADEVGVGIAKVKLPEEVTESELICWVVGY